MARLIDADELKKAFAESKHIFETTDGLDIIEMLAVKEIIDNAPTVTSFTLEDIEGIRAETIKMMKNRYARPQGECKGCEYLKDCETCEDKAKQYSLGFQDGYLLGGFQLAELRRWLIAQGYSEGTVDDKIENFGKFVKRVREDER